MGFLTEQDLRDLLFAGVAIDLGYAKTHQVAFALQQALGGSGEESIRQALVGVAQLDDAQIAEVEAGLEQYLSATAGDPRAALAQAGGLPGKVFSQLAAEAPMVSQGLAELEPKKLDKLAIGDLQELLKKRPDTHPAHFALGFVYEANKDKRSAAEHYRKYLAVVKQGPFVERAAKRLVELRSK